MDNKFREILEYLPSDISQTIAKIPAIITSKIFEIRLRANQPIALSAPDEILFVTQKGEISRINRPDLIKVTPQKIAQTFANVCEHSIHSHQHEIANGYITARGGHRVGICGTAVYANREIINIKDISSLNFRIARAVNCAENIVKILKDLSGGMLIAGAPASGKTTMLRDIARRLSCGINCTPKRVVIVDERGEIAAAHRGISTMDLGPNCDVYSNVHKVDGIMLALRAMNPDFIIFDEISTLDEINAVKQSFNGGAKIITTMHAGNVQEVKSREQTKLLHNTQAISDIVLLGGKGENSRIIQHIKMGEIFKIHRQVS